MLSKKWNLVNHQAYQIKESLYENEQNEREITQWRQLQKLKIQKNLPLCGIFFPIAVPNNEVDKKMNKRRQRI